MEKQSEQCPKCGCKEIGQGKQAGHAVVLPNNKFFAMGSQIIHHICTQCGYVLESYVDKPSRFKE
ncbi:transcription initiation factor TFIIIB [Brevibacillus panacihumi W25]|uniref:Transcription initiation factor TFIIIB n=1 Tax=Brevibacillus panacihumi W25 TaxID=1408254 RepID=V6ME35_9BACL|nr:transcription initiation factor TFIIIB [Brevibacillus panacihumi]EST56160.1 transcription initiation factor TFIIIB [Brevibacillus panacihumi W25]